ncbi:MAG: glycosyltransferase family 2 protein [Anaerolineae bacterium]
MPLATAYSVASVRHPTTAATRGASAHCTRERIIVDVIKALFWLAAAGLAYTWLGYPLLIAGLARLRPRPVRRAEITPDVTLLVAAYNEAGYIEAKIANVLALDYPADRLELLVVTDGSTDATPALVAACAARDPRVRLLHEPARRGKTAALARALPYVRGEIVAFSDANCLFEPATLRRLVRPLADPQVVATSGRKRLRAAGGAVDQGDNLYWRYEGFLKACESAVGSVMGVPGEIWAVRRAAYQAPEPDCLLDDFVASLRLVARGGRVVYDPEAIATEDASPSLAAEWQRRVRVAAGGWQAFFRLPEMLTRPGPLATWQYLSHRMARWMLAPLLLGVLALANLALPAEPFYLGTLALQGGFYLLAAAGWLLAARGRRGGLLTAPFYVALLHAAALAGGLRYLRGRQTVLWDKVR